MKRYIYYFTFSILSIGILITGCNHTGTNPNPINGTWQLISAERYVHIDIPNIDAYEKEYYLGGCYTRHSFKIHNLSGDKYVTTRTEGTDTETDTVSIHIENDILIVNVINGTETEKYKRTTTDLSQLELCNGEN